MFWQGWENNETGYVKSTRFPFRCVYQFIFIAELRFIVQRYHDLFIHLSVLRYLLFLFLAIMNHATYSRGKWQPTPVFFPGESQGRQSLVGCRLWGRTESDTTEVT